MDHIINEFEELEALRARDEVSEDELLARVQAAPDMGGSLLVELSEFATRRVLQEAA